MFANMSVRAKVYFSFGVILICTAALGMFSIERLSTVNSEAAEIRDNWLPSVGVVGSLLAEANRYRLYEAGAVVSGDYAAASKEETSAKGVAEGIEKIRAVYEPLVTPGFEADTYRRFGEEWDKYLKLSREKLFPAARSNDDATAGALLRGESRDQFNIVRELAKKLADFNAEGGKIAADQGAATYRSASIAIAIFVLIALAIGVGAAFVINAGVSKPIRLMTVLMERLASHDLSAEVRGAERGDEIGAMARAVAVFKDGLIKADELKAEQDRGHAAESARVARVDALLSRFESVASSTMRTIASAATELDATAKSMSITAESSNERATAVAAAAEQAGVNVQTVASAAEEMAASIREISNRVSESSGIARGAVEEVERTNETVRGLTEAARRIGDVVGLIAGIASQTNLLALNATIEAARAGEAGKGFAVVASEVKLLANQTGKATEDISAQVSAIQSVTDTAVKAIAGIGGTIGRVDEITSAVAAAVEQQGAATSEISRNAHEAATGTREVSSGTVEVTRAASETGAAAGQVMSAASELATQAENFRREIERFLSEIKAA